jgi:hypothetical protein
VDLDAAVHLIDVPGASGRLGTPHRGPVQLRRITDPLGSNQGVGGPGQRQLEQGRNLQRDVEVVEGPNDDGVVTG